MLEPLDFGDVKWDWSRPYVLGIVNVTPDSFSDGGRYATTDAAVAHGERLLAEGADALDIGGESTRPGAAPVPEAEELARVLPVIRALVARGALVSVDTTKSVVAAAALDAGARIINDVGMGEPPGRLGRVAAERGAAYILMHSRGSPATMASLAHYDDPVEDVVAELAAGAEALRNAGLPPSKIILDPGIGFAKRAEQSLSLLANVARLRALGYAVCVGPSRKSFIDAAEAYAPAWSVSPSAPEARVGGTAAAVAFAVAAGAEIVRVHDVGVMRQAARIAHALRLRARGGRDA